ncbi:MAG: 3-methyl-adenine DNA glycosylase II [Methanomassiliicoccales archaeon PtaU1.Bin124]|nr:MAG: 3-methyl-adenine DNA glycosylase II [Methanomassiliicoccales archaeon PtaU1.Bin124]
MRLEPFDLDKTLSCGQVFRWRKRGEWWEGIVDGKDVRVRQTAHGVKADGMSDDRLRRYFRADDDLDCICQDIMVNCGDERMSLILSDQRGLRLVRQDPWECCASYILATYVHIPRIEQMIDRVCTAYGDPLPSGRYAFPRPEQIAANPDAARSCGLGFRCDRFLAFSKMVDRGEVDLNGIGELPYEECVKELRSLPGIGEKVADCVALFSMDHLEAFPVDVRIKKSMEHFWGITGSYKRVNRDSRMLFGPYAGYAQECIYLFMQGKTRNIRPC